LQNVIKSDAEIASARAWLSQFNGFLHGEQIDWGTKSAREVKVFTKEGRLEVEEDPRWERQMIVAEKLAGGLFRGG
jgi:hypothetical protein